jgi:hypothetical protein
MAFVPLTRPDGSVIEVNPNLVDALEPVPGASPACTFVSFIGDSSTRETVLGTVAAVSALLNAGSTFQPIESGGYGPPGTAVSGPISLIAGFGANFERVGQVVTVGARFELTFASSGVSVFEFPTPTTPGLPFMPGTVRGVASSTDNPYTGAPSADPGPIVRENGANIAVELANGTGGPKRVTLLVQYQTP